MSIKTQCLFCHLWLTENPDSATLVIKTFKQAVFWYLRRSSFKQVLPHEWPQYKTAYLCTDKTGTQGY